MHHSGMNFRSTILYSVRTALGQWRIAVVVYALQLGLALIWGMQVREVLQASIGSSMALERLLAGFDYTVFADFLHVHGASITPLLGQLRWLALVWLIFSVFIQGGMLYCAVSPGRTRWLDFWQGGAAYFFPFIKMAAVFLGGALLWSALIWAPVLLALMPALTGMPSEAYAVWGVLLALALWLAGLAVLFVWSVLGRLAVIREGVSVWGGVRRGGRVLRRGWKRWMGVLALFLGVQGLLWWGYWQAESGVGMVSAGWILVFFVWQQLVVWARVWVRQALFVAFSRV